eukprot:5969606-Amphidinium_carterae.1
MQCHIVGSAITMLSGKSDIIATSHLKLFSQQSLSLIAPRRAQAFNGLNAIPYYELEAVRAKTGKAAKAKTKTKKALASSCQVVTD